MQKKNSTNASDTDFTADTMELERENRRRGFLNLERGIFAGTLDGGLNTTQSVFDKTAVFHASGKKEEP